MQEIKDLIETALTVTEILDGFACMLENATDPDYRGRPYEFNDFQKDAASINETLDSLDELDVSSEDVEEIKQKAKKTINRLRGLISDRI